MNVLEDIKHELEKWPGNEYRSTLWWNVRKLHGYLSEHSEYLVNYAERYRKGLPISSGIAESAVNQVVSLRMAKKRQMRWSDHGAHALAQVRVAVLNAELSPRSFGASDSTMQDWNVTEPGELLRLAA